MRTKQQSSSTLEPIHSRAAGIDIGAQTHWVCVPVDCDANNVRSFGCFTADLHALADWLLSVWHQDCRYGIYRGLLDSTVSNLGNTRL